MAPSPITPAGLQLVAELEQIKIAHRLNSSAIAQILCCERYTVNRYLRGHTTIPKLELKTLLKELGWREDETRFQILMDMRDKASQPVWYSEFGLTEDLNQLVGFESSATRIRVFEPMFVFGPLQTEDYARAVIKPTMSPGVSEDEVEQRLRLRLERQRRIYRVDPPPARVVLSEAAIRANVGGPTVMAAQLTELAELPAPWELRVLPLGIGAHPGMRGGFWLFEFPEPRRPAVYVDGHRQNIYLDDSVSFSESSVDFDLIWELALSPADSRAMLLRVAEEAQNA